MPKFEGPYKVLEIKGNNLVIWKNGRNITVNIDQVRVYRPRQSDTISSDSPVETLYDEQEVSHGSNRSHQGQFKEHRKTSSQESEGCRSRQGNTTREIPRNKRKINSTASKDQALKRSKICKKRSRQGSDHQDRKRHAPEQGQESRGRSLPRSRLLRLQVDPEWKLVDVITRPVRPERQREDATNKRRNQSGRIKPIQGDLAHTIYGAVYKKKTEFHEELSNIEINGIPGSTFRRRSLSMEALNGDPRDLHNGAQRINPENRVGSSFRIIPGQYFSGIENIDDFLENIDHNLAYYEIPAQLACAYLKGHLKGRALDWFEVLGYRVIEDKTTDYAHLKQALSEQFPVVRNRSELETRFYSSSQRRDQQPLDFIYELLKIHKVLKLEMSEEKLIDHVVSRLEPQILDYVEVRHPRNTANLLQIVDKYEERFMHRQIRGSSEGFRSSGPHENNRFNTRHRQENWRENRNNERYANNSRPQREFNRFENQGFTKIADSRVDAKVDNRINHSTVKAVDKVGREIVHFEVKMNEVEI
ncbi:uncharacterized protein TNCV_3477451 [Trichonephila clavipes]|nr:uncharacterized protein TNCV_3477451 [Trichonephila clavipes]